MSVRMLISLINQLIQAFTSNPKCAIVVIIGIVQKLVIMLIYYFEQGESIEDWKDHPLPNIYMNLTKLRNSMKEFDNTSLHHAFLGLDVEVDETIHSWYEQEKAGVPETARVGLTLDQQQQIKQQKDLEITVNQRRQKLEQAYVNGTANRNGSIFTVDQMNHLIPG